jgi:hypothetical protein
MGGGKHAMLTEFGELKHACTFVKILESGHGRGTLETIAYDKTDLESNLLTPCVTPTRPLERKKLANITVLT